MYKIFFIYNNPFDYVKSSRECDIFPPEICRKGYLLVIADPASNLMDPRRGDEMKISNVKTFGQAKEFRIDGAVRLACLSLSTPLSNINDKVIRQVCMRRSPGLQSSACHTGALRHATRRRIRSDRSPFRTFIDIFYLKTNERLINR